jgi:oxygen-independent coproporphyrinogen-3 oxidase
LKLTQLPPLSLYIHIPWCVRKCPYCDFNSHSRALTDIPEHQYVQALQQDLHSELAAAQERPISSIFIGGGTPSLLSASAIDQILTSAREMIGFTENIEITLEANPGTIDSDKFAGYHQAGVNRLSLGIQSFNALHLQHLGRIHDPEQAKQAIAIARQVGFDNINLDLMHGLPGQSADLAMALSFSPEHLSWYQLTIEPNTEFFNRPPTLPADDDLADIQLAGENQLADAGYQHYEVSAFCRPGNASLHNMNYWQFGDYIGIGAGAHGKITDRNSGHICRRWKTRQPERYLARDHDFSAGETQITTDELALEFMMNALRLNQGVPRSLFYERTGLADEAIAETCQRLCDKGLMIDSQTTLKLTELGRRFLNDVLAAFDPESD